MTTLERVLKELADAISSLKMSFRMVDFIIVNPIVEKQLRRVKCYDKDTKRVRKLFGIDVEIDEDVPKDIAILKTNRGNFNIKLGQPSFGMECGLMERENISVLIPCKNEIKTIKGLLKKVLKNKRIEVIIIDGKSTDGTYEVAKALADKSKSCKLIVQNNVLEGKGGALRDGLTIAKGDIIVFIDADIESLEEDWINKLVEPVVNGRADIAKASYEYTAGRDIVTRLIAKPLLAEFFPEVNFNRPIEGEVAFRRGILDNIALGNGLEIESRFIIDVVMQGFKIEEVFLGEKRQKERHGEALSKLTLQVVNAIMSKAVEYKRI